MKNLAILVAMILFSCCVTLSQARDLDSIPSLSDEKLAWWSYHNFHPHHYPYFYPKPPHWPSKPPHWPSKPPHWPFPAAGKAFPPLPAGYKHPMPYHPSPEVAKCLSDCKDARVCYADIHKAFVTRNPILGSDCCSAIVKMTKDCENTLFGHFHNNYFNCFIKLHCSTKGGSTPSAPSPA